mgnify:CR=1 FL=1
MALSGGKTVPGILNPKDRAGCIGSRNRPYCACGGLPADVVASSASACGFREA